MGAPQENHLDKEVLYNLGQRRSEIIIRQTWLLPDNNLQRLAMAAIFPACIVATCYETYEWAPDYGTSVL